MQPDLVSGRDVLPLGDDPVGAVDIAAGQVFQEVIAVEPASGLPQLGDPRPDPVRRGAHGERARGGQIGPRDELIAGERLGELLGGGAPSQLPAPAEEQPGGSRACCDGYSSPVPSFHLVLLPVLIWSACPPGRPSLRLQGDPRERRCRRGPGTSPGPETP